MKHRLLRVNEVVKRELSGIIAREISFEGALVTINHVDVTPDLKNAHVFVSVLGSEKAESVMKKLEEHRAAFQSELAATRHLEIHAASGLSSRRLDRARLAHRRNLAANRQRRPKTRVSAAKFDANRPRSCANISGSPFSATSARMATRSAASWRSVFRSRSSAKTFASGTRTACSRNIVFSRARICSRKPPAEPEDVDVVVALDTAIQNRLGNTVAAIQSAKVWINIDHHPSNPGYGDLVYIDPTAPATGQILFELIKSQNLPIDRAIAENLYVAISTDTGSFQYPNTTARTFEIAAELVRAGVDVGRVSQLTYENYPRRRVELLRELLGTMHFDADDRVASFSLSLATAKKLGVLPEDNEGLIDHLRAIHGVIVAIFFEELSDGKVRVSMRSKNEKVNVCAICEKFGGGGHILAAGARVRGTLAEVEKKILEEVCDVVSRNS